MKCSQTGKEHAVKIKDLSLDSGEDLTKDYLTPGSELIWTYDLARILL